MDFFTKYFVHDKYRNNLALLKSVLIMISFIPFVLEQ